MVLYHRRVQIPDVAGLPGSDRVRDLFDRYVVPSYGRFDIVLERGEGSYVWDSDMRRYLDFAAGIAVCVLGHANTEIANVLHDQARKLTHVSNLYYNELQGRLAKRLVDLIGPGRCFFCNSGAEANEGLFKLARKFGHDGGRYEIITAFESFHGRTLAGISATGQEKVKKGFEPMVTGFKHVPFNDLEAIQRAVTEQTAAILIEPVQGESGITLATKEYLLGLRQLCDERNLLLLFDEVQAGHFRTGKFQSWQTICGMGFQPMKGQSGSDHRQDADATMQALGGSRFLKVCYGLKQGPVPALDLELEIAVQEAVRELIHCGLVKSAHDCSEGGLAVALTECCFNPEGLLGANINVAEGSGVRDSGSVAAATATLFNEAQSRIVISVAPEKVEQAIRIIKDRNVPYQQLGEVEDKELSIRIADEEFRWPIADLHDDWWNAIRRAVERDESIPSL